MQPMGTRYAIAVTISGSSLGAGSKIGLKIMVGCVATSVNAVEHLWPPNSSNCGTGETFATTMIVHQRLTSRNEPQMPSPLPNTLFALCRRRHHDPYLALLQNRPTLPRRKMRPPKGTVRTALFPVRLGLRSRRVRQLQLHENRPRHRVMRVRLDLPKAKRAVELKRVVHRRQRIETHAPVADAACFFDH